jgi:hypothetical protein
MGLVNSLKKSWKIRSISKILGAPFDASNLSDVLAPGKSSKSDQVMESLFNLCESDSELKKVMMKYGASRKTLEDLYKMLIANGAGQWEQGHYVPVSALTFGSTLQFLLEKSDALPWSKICILLLEYFERKEVGPVPLDVRGPSDPNDPFKAVWEMEQKLKRDE